MWINVIYPIFLIHRKWIKFKSMWPSDAIQLGQHRPDNGLLPAWSIHYLNQCWLAINKILWYKVVFEIYTFEITVTSPRGQWMNCGYLPILQQIRYHHHLHVIRALGCLDRSSKYTNVPNVCKIVQLFLLETKVSGCDWSDIRNLDNNHISMPMAILVGRTLKSLD